MLEKRLAVMWKKSKDGKRLALRHLELQHEGTDLWEELRPSRRLLEMPKSRRANFDTKEPPHLSLYDDSSIGGRYIPPLKPQLVSANINEVGNIQITSTNVAQ